MRILAKYFSKEFFKILLLCMLIFVSIYLIIDFLAKIEVFSRANISGTLILTYFFYKIPYVIVQMVPVASLLSVIVMFCLMKKNNEIAAMKGCGMSIFKLSQPIIFVSILIASTVFLFSELIVPYASSRSNEIWNIDVKKRKQKRFYGGNHIWYKGADSIYWIRHFDAKKNIMEDPTLYFFDDSFHLIRRIDARRGIWTGHKWKLQDGIIQQARNDGGFELKNFDETILTLFEKPEAFSKTVKRPEEMSYWQLKRYAERIRLEGYDATRYLVDMNIKLAFPLVNVIMVFMGIPLALGLKRGGTPLAVSLGIGTCFLYLVTLGLARSLGLCGILPPIFSAWLANLIFFLFGMFLMMHLET